MRLIGCFWSRPNALVHNIKEVLYDIIMSLVLYIPSCEYGHLAVNTSRSSLSLFEASAIIRWGDVQASRGSCFRHICCYV